MQVGELSIQPIADGVALLPPTVAYSGAKGARDEDWEPHRNLLTEDGKLQLSLGGFLVRTGDRLVLVDTGVGTLVHDVFKGGALLDSLAAADVRPEDVTDVVFTHLHFDHVGWATQQGRVVFTNATYRCDERDWAHFVGPDAKATRKLTPIADRLEPWSGSGTLMPGIDLMSAPGHTPGSTIIVLSSGEERAMLLGDVVHCPVELLDDEWAGLGDVDAELAKRTRVALARELEGADVPVAAAHFPGMQFGRLLAGSGTRHWVFD